MFGIYIHFPYCRKRCPYCDFAVHARARIPHDRYLRAVQLELERAAAGFAGRTLGTVYFGGGTPSLWRADCVAALLTSLRGAFAHELGEVTLEANPDELEPEQLLALRRAGVDRLSIGAQSFDAAQLRGLGRLHDGAQTERVVAAARAAGFTNLSLDLMFALPAQTLAALERELDRLLALAPEHVSLYNLTIEERTAFDRLVRRGALRLPDAGLAADMFAHIEARLEREGFVHYEISSYARPGREARHNSGYWRGGEYLGLGCGAHSHRRLPDGSGERWANVRSVDRWFAALDAQQSPIAEREQLTPAALEREAMWLGLRLLGGLSRQGHAARFGVDPLSRHQAEIARLVGEGLLEVEGDRVRLSRRGRLFADEVGARFV